jgi:hypothetical protein
MKAHLAIGAAVLAFSATATNAQVFVPSTNSSPTLIGPVSSGQTYTVTATGTADLLNGFNSGQGVTFDANGIPTYAFPSPYSAFYPNGLDYDPSQGTSAYGIGGAGMLYGALLGTFTATPSGPSDYFLLGSSDSFTSALNGNLYAVINDCVNCYSDNNGQSGFTVTLALATGRPVGGVPEPETWALMLLGFAGIGLAIRYRRSTMRPLRTA